MLGGVFFFNFASHIKYFSTHRQVPVNKLFFKLVSSRIPKNHNLFRVSPRLKSFSGKSKFSKY